MPRVGRIAPGGLIYHVLNRGNGRQRLFRKPADYAAYAALLPRVGEAVPGVSVLGYCLMPNHWHLVLRPAADGELSSYMLRLQTAHVRRHYAHYRDAAGGHLYQGRFKSFPVQDDHHLLTLLRYVEANPLRGGLVREPEDWAWCSYAARRTAAGAALLHEGPVDRPRGWRGLLLESLPPTEVEAIRTSLRRGRPLGDERWTRRTAARLGLEFTIRPRGRPRHGPAGE